MTSSALLNNTVVDTHLFDETTPTDVWNFFRHISQTVSVSICRFLGDFQEKLANTDEKYSHQLHWNDFSNLLWVCCHSNGNGLINPN